MKNKKFSMWLRRLPVFLLALILAVSPFAMAVSADASSDVLSGSPAPSPSVPGYIPLMNYDQGDGSSVYVYVNDEYSNTILSNTLFLVDLVTPRAYMVWAPNVSVVDTTLTWRGVANYSCAWIIRTEDGDTSLSIFLDEPDFSSSLTSPYTIDRTVWFLLYGSHVSVQTDTLMHFPFYFNNAPSGDGVLSVFSGVGSWLSGAVQNIFTMFWTAETGMTVLGYLAVASLALAVILLIFYLIAGWLKFH